MLRHTVPDWYGCWKEGSGIVPFLGCGTNMVVPAAFVGDRDDLTFLRLETHEQVVFPILES